MKLQIFPLTLLMGAMQLLLPICTLDATSSSRTQPLLGVDYIIDRPFIMNMSDTKDITIGLKFDELIVKHLKFDMMHVKFKSTTISPQFDILTINPATQIISISRSSIEHSDYYFTGVIRLHANYIGHAILKPISIELTSLNSTGTMILDSRETLDVTIVQFEGIWGKLFVISVLIFITITYINLGAQLDKDNIQEMIKKPKTVIVGFVITVIVMPTISWFVGYLLLSDQLLYRVGSFIFACGPAASASTLWTVMLNSDKELSVGLQVVSTIGALATMPLLLYFMDTSMNLGNAHYAVKVPYGRLIQTLLGLLIALFIGWRFVGTNEKAQKISRRIFRPLTFFVLIFIIVFSSFVYWHIYQMFDWNITISSLIISIGTYLISGLMGHLINFNVDHAIAISIGSTYKNSGITFAVLLLAFGAPDTYIAYVPCLTQVVTTSLSLYLIYTVRSLKNCIQRRNQPGPIQAVKDEGQADEPGSSQKKDRSDSGCSGHNSTKNEENDEFIAMNVTDVTPESLLTRPSVQENLEVKVISEEPPTVNKRDV